MPGTSRRPSSYEGLQGHIRALKTPALETWKNQYPDKDYEVEMTAPEFTCLCPKTGQPDFATLTIAYVPDRRCVELKSLREYLHAFRDVGIFHEHVVNKVLEDFVRAVAPRRARIVGEFNVRGGIRTVVRAEYAGRDSSVRGHGRGRR